MKLYNTLTRKKEEFKPLRQAQGKRPAEVGIYSCGPTVYDYAHIGHARTYVFADLLRKVLLYNGYQVRQVMNITDVGHLTEADISDEGQDKIEMAAKKEKKTVWDIAKFYTDDFFKMTKDLNILPPSVVCKATDHIKKQIELIKRIEKNGYAYMIDRGVCFDTTKFPQYAEFARLDLKGMKKGSRVEFDPQKRNPTDFWLWRFSDPKEKRQMEWDSPWGKGFPGWHIECSAMSMKYLGERFDIHTGGIDHIPVHHTNEIAQNWAVTGHQVVNFWLHGAFLTIEGEKMAKSLKNFYRLEDIKKRGFDPLALRYLFLTAHYRQKMNFTWKALAAAQRALDRLRGFTSGGKESGEDTSGVTRRGSPEVEEYKKRFLAVINDDLNMPQALAVVWEMIRDKRYKIKDKRELILDWDRVLGLRLAKLKVKSEKLKVGKEVRKLVEKREELRKKEMWREADEIRKKIEDRGWKVEDMAEGPKVKKICS